MNILINVNTILQIIDRVFRIDQKRHFKIWIYFVDNFYDQMIQARAINKMIDQIAGQDNVNRNTILRILSRSLSECKLRIIDYGHEDEDE